jgi:tetratricopeptide (TPR) repeat protein
MQEKRYDRAVFYFGKAANLNPRSAHAMYHLAMAEEGRYSYFAAGKAYARALELAPENTSIRNRFEAFQRKVARNN